MKVLLVILALSIFQSCENKVEEQKVEIVAPSKSGGPVKIRETTFPKRTKTFEGAYIGRQDHLSFGRGGVIQSAESFTVVSVDESEKIITGHYIGAGGKTPFKGKYTTDESGNMSALPIEDTKPSAMFGSSISQPQELKINSDGTKLSLIWFRRESRLLKAVSKYNPNLAIDLQHYSSLINGPGTKIPEGLNASTQKLSEAVLKSLKKEDFQIIRNSIYGRHGMAFHKQADIFFFENIVKGGYGPFFVNVDDKLTELEKTNIALLERYEKLAFERPTEVLLRKRSE